MIATKEIHLHSTGNRQLDRLLDDSPQQTKCAALILLSVAVLDEGMGNRIARRLERQLGCYLDDLGPGDNAADAAASRRWRDIGMKLDIGW